MGEATHTGARNFKADFRSDTVTKPVSMMKSAMLEAELGDDVYGDDASVNALEAKAADFLGKEAALFVPSGTQSNLLAIMSHCQRGEEFLTGQGYHIQVAEAMGSAILASVASHPLPPNENGELNEEDIIAAIKPDDSHYPITRLLAIENTFNGTPFPVSYMKRMANLAKEHKLGLHCDGARLLNAAIALETPAKDLVKDCDTVSLCLSKGLGAPVGSVLAGSSDAIGRARRGRKMLGGGMRQAGMLAAAGIYALDHHINRLAEDHQRAATLHKSLSSVSELKVSYSGTNMLFVELPPQCDPDALAQFLNERQLIITPSQNLRLVTHLDIDDEACENLTESLTEFIGLSAN